MLALHCVKKKADQLLVASGDWIVYVEIGNWTGESLKRWRVRGVEGEGDLMLILLIWTCREFMSIHRFTPVIIISPVIQEDYCLKRDVFITLFTC